MRECGGLGSREQLALGNLDQVRCDHPGARENVVTASKPMQPIEKGLASPGLMAHVITSKYADHLPLHRMERILRRHGVDIARSTMCDWMAQCAALLNPLYALMKRRVLESHVVHTDDTPVPVQDKSKTRTRQGRIWTYLGDYDQRQPGQQVSVGPEHPPQLTMPVDCKRRW